MRNQTSYICRIVVSKFPIGSRSNHFRHSCFLKGFICPSSSLDKLISILQGPLEAYAPQWGQLPYRSPFGSMAQMNRFTGPCRTQQMLGALPSNHNPQDNAFRLPTNKPLQQSYAAAAPQPRRMSGVSHLTPKYLPSSGFNTGHDWKKSGNPLPSNFKSRQFNLK